MIRFIDLPNPSSGIPYVNTDFTSVLQDEHLKSYASILDGINRGSTSSSDPLNNGIILKGCGILSADGSSFNMSFTNSVVYIDGEFYQIGPNVTTKVMNDPFYIYPGPTVSEFRTLPIDQLTTTTFSHTRYFTYSNTLPTGPYIKFSNRGTSRYYKRVLKYFTSREGDIYMTRSLNNFDINGNGINDMEGFVILDSNSGISGLPNLGSRFLKGWDTPLALNNVQPGDFGGSHSHALQPDESGYHNHGTGEARFAQNWTLPFTANGSQLTKVSLTNVLNISGKVGSFNPYTGGQPFGATYGFQLGVIEWNQVNYDPNGYYNTGTAKFKYTGTQPVRLRFVLNLSLRSLTYPNTIWVDQPSPGITKDDIAIWVARSKKKDGTDIANFTKAATELDIFYGKFRFVPFKDKAGALTGCRLGGTFLANSPEFDTYEFNSGYAGLKLRQFIGDFNQTSYGQGDNPVWTKSSINIGGWSFIMNGIVTTEYITARPGEEFLFYLFRGPGRSNTQPGPIETYLQSSSMEVQYDVNSFNDTDADLHHYHYMNTGRFQKDAYDNDITTPLSLGKATREGNLWPAFVNENGSFVFYASVSPDAPNPADESVANETTGSVFGRIEFGDLTTGGSSPYFTGGISNRPNSELQNHKHTISQINFGNGVLGDPGSEHENRPPYLVTVYYTKKSNQ